MIVKVENEQNIWVVRCESGAFYQHFRKFGIAAIGHLDSVIKDKITAQTLYDSIDNRVLELEGQLKKKELSNQAIAARANQVNRFVEHIKPGDLVVTTDGASSLSVGRVLGNAYFDRSPLEVEDLYLKHPPITLKHGLRRKVAWGPSIQRKNWPINVKRALSGNLTVFGLAEHKKAIYHLLYPFFEDNDGLNTTILINQEQEIDNFSVSSLFRFLSRIETLSIAAATLDNPQLTVDELKNKADQLFFSMNLSLTSKAQFMSEGDIQSTLKENREQVTAVLKLLGRKHVRQYIYFVTALTLIGGNSHLGLPGFIDKEMIRAAGGYSVDLVEKVAAKIWTEEQGSRAADRLKPSFSRAETQILTDHKNDEMPITKTNQGNKK